MMGCVASFWVLCDTLSQCCISGTSIYIHVNGPKKEKGEPRKKDKRVKEGKKD